ncbi:MAG: sulfatase-like hydrolase/transferase [Alteromonadaceae bacterium]|nr:sulfatase-like hydrolase/transferase [Alteromonadaceae bacterium]
MNRMLLIVILGLIPLPGVAEEKSERPNVIFILADDLGSGDLHITGHPYAKTPNLDKLAAKGIRFERAYMPAAWCAPSRYGLMSGQYPARNFNASKDLKANEPSITKILNDAGYATAHYGKWHMNYSNDFAENPGDFGIDEHFTTNHNGNGKTWTKKEKNSKHWRERTTDAYVDMAINFINKTESEKTPKPFYINLWIYPTHSYIDPTPEQLALYKDLKVDLNDFSEQQQEFLKFVSKHGDIDKAMQAYCADVTAMDNALGRLLDYINETGLDENTLIVFSSDNGPGPLTNQITSKSIVERYKKKPTLLNSVGSAKNYRDRKSSFHEGGIRVPFIASWPGHIPEGKVDDSSIIQGVDWLPTIASISNIELPKGTFDGIDVKSAFYGNGITRKEPLFWSEKGSSVILKDNFKGVMIKKQFALYDITKDPSEQTNLKDSHSEIANHMQDDLQQWHKSLGRN